MEGHVRSLAGALAFLVIVCSGAAGAAPVLSPGDHAFSLDHQGLARSYLLRVPPAAAANKPLPVVVNFHGGGSNAKTQKWYSRMDATADRGGFIAVYPNGSGGVGDRFHTWNAGNCCGWAAVNRIDDVGFTLAVLDDLARRMLVDHARVYATGLSNGSMMAYRLAAEASERIAAVAGVAGAMTLPTFAPKLPMPVLHIHSVDDERARYDGGLGPAFPMTDTRVFHASVSDMLTKWLEHNRCPAARSAAPAIAGSGADAGHTAMRFTWSPCRAGSEVILLRLAGPGHVWPGGQRDFLPVLLGTSTAVVDANDEMWRFFSRFRRGTR